VLALLCAVELDPRRQRIVAYVQDDAARSRLHLVGLGDVIGTGRRAALAVADDSRLQRAALVEVEAGAQWGARAVRVEPSLLWALVGDRSAEPELPPGCHAVGGPEIEFAGAPFVVVTGADRVRRLAVAFAATAGTGFLVTPEPDDERSWRAVVREATLSNLAIVLEVDGDLGDLSRRWVDRAQHLAFAISSRDEIPIIRLPERPHVERRSVDDLASPEEWQHAVGDDAAAAHPLTAEQLRRVGRVLPSVGGDVAEAIRRLASGPLERLAVRIRPERTWDDLVLPPEQESQLREMVARYRHRRTVYVDWGFAARPSHGLVGMFSGPSGTGKTLAAEVVAGDLGLDLYKIELSAVLSKWIGETEKNLEEIFSAAEASDVVLLFDEADALFGKRSEVTDAKDRYANVETAYLLQRLERHSGVILLTSNLHHNLDEAFTRRIHAVVAFAVPEAAQRLAIWRRSFGPGTPMQDVDLEGLSARHELAGGSIRNVALTAAFLAADEGTPITSAYLDRCLEREYAKLRRLAI
jgi:AAA+ superfamily predicted ATPase